MNCILHSVFTIVKCYFLFYTEYVRLPQSKEPYMDICFKTPNEIFSLRAAALIIDNNRLLIIKNEDLNCFYTIGGGIQENESSDKAVIRELYEETGYDFEAEKLLFIQERFYKAENSCHHEIVFFYLMKEIDFEIQNGMITDRQNEHLYWIPIEDLENINLVPTFLKTALRNIPDEITHIISYE